jgi:hypothetical protein
MGWIAGVADVRDGASVAGLADIAGPICIKSTVIVLFLIFYFLIS